MPAGQPVHHRNSVNLVLNSKQEQAKLAFTLALTVIAIIFGVLGVAAYSWTPRQRIRRLDKQHREEESYQ
jgi:hypothetical protein